MNRRFAGAAALVVGAAFALTACAGTSAPVGDVDTATDASPHTAPSAPGTPGSDGTPEASVSSASGTPSSLAPTVFYSAPHPDSHCGGTGRAAAKPGVVHVYVSIADQHLWECTGGDLDLDTAVTTGASALTNVHDATPTGTFGISGKKQHTHLKGHDVNGAWDDAVTYWLPFSGGDGFHDSPWQTFPLGGPEYTTQGSHGCVHTPLDALARLYSDVTVGTPVTIS